MLQFAIWTPNKYYGTPIGHRTVQHFELLFRSFRVVPSHWTEIVEISTNSIWESWQRRIICPTNTLTGVHNPSTFVPSKMSRYLRAVRRRILFSSRLGSAATFTMRRRQAKYWISRSKRLPDDFLLYPGLQRHQCRSPNILQLRLSLSSLRTCIIANWHHLSEHRTPIVSQLQRIPDLQCLHQWSGTEYRSTRATVAGFTCVSLPATSKIPCRMQHVPQHATQGKLASRGQRQCLHNHVGMREMGTQPKK